ncbi:MAG: hypothetical protein MUD03_04135 [Pirellula sp.]|nr:hypothetical protein [Pirellula sp.]
MPAARVGDQILQDGPHCHAPIHPAAPTPTPQPHPPMPLAIVKGQANVFIGGVGSLRLESTMPQRMRPALARFLGQQVK